MSDPKAQDSLGDNPDLEVGDEVKPEHDLNLDDFREFDFEEVQQP